MKMASRRRRRAKALPRAGAKVKHEVKHEEMSQEERNKLWSLIGEDTASSSSQPAATRSGDYNDKVFHEPAYMQALERLVRRDPTIDKAEGSSQATVLQGTDVSTVFMFFL